MRIPAFAAALALAAGLVSPAFALTETPQQEFDYWLTCGGAMGAYSTMFEDAPTAESTARVNRFNAVLPRAEQRASVVAAALGEEQSKATSDAVFKRLTDEIRPMLESSNAKEQIIARYAPMMDACSARMEKLPA